MRWRSRPRSLVLWSSRADLADTYRGPAVPRTRQIRRCVRIGVLLIVIGLNGLAHAVRGRWRPLLSGGVLTVVGVILRSGPGGFVLLPGLLLLMSAPLIEGSPDADRKRRRELQRQLAGFSTHAQRCDLEATLDRYPDAITYELRDILASQAMSACGNGVSERRTVQRLQ
jgi:hypothetical protein